jgi:dinuclear metal center YbgI/SA1388 family protein
MKADMKLKNFIETLEEIAPPELAESWDHTGLLIEPLKPREIKKVLLTIDLTEAVAREAVQRRVDAIVSYHPLFFEGFNALTKSSPQARAAMRIIPHGIAVYSPHTALDAAPGGVNDWLADALGEGDIYCDECTSARMVEPARPVKLSTFITHLKKNLRLKSVRTASAHNRPLKTIAVCAGAGAETLRDIRADCWLTGEMKHHDILAAKQNGISVILCGHTETERGYLPVLRSRIRVESEGSLDVLISKMDASPLKAL